MFDPQVLAFTLVAALGVSVILMHSAAAFTVLKIAGACYLVWLGIQSLRSAGRVTTARQPAAAAATHVPALRSFREGCSRHFFMRPRQRQLIDAACGTILVALGFRLAWQQQ